MLESKFLFVGKIFLLAFFLINFPNFLPFSFSETSFWILIFTTIFDTATLLVLSLSISKYINLKNLKFFENLYKNDSSNQNFIDKINTFSIRTIQDRKLSFIIFIFFVISTVLQPIILIFDLNKNDLYTTSVVNSINRDFEIKKNNIENIISIQKKQKIDGNEIINLENSISNLSNTRDVNIERFLKSNTNNKFNTSKIIIRNILLGLLWTFVFYKLYSI